MCVNIRICVPVCRCLWRSEEGVNTLEMELQAGVRLEPKLRSSARKAI